MEKDQIDIGRDATGPASMPRRGWFAVLRRVFDHLFKQHIGLMAAGIAFYGLLAIFPAITTAVALVGLVYDPAALASESGWLLSALPQDAQVLIDDQLRKVASAESGSLGVAALISLGIALWSASNATASVIEGLNVINEEEETRSFIALRLMTIALTVAIVLGLSVAVVIVAAIPALLGVFAQSDYPQTVAMIVRWPAMFVIGIIGIATLYRHGPDRRGARWRWLTPGAVTGCTLWVLGTVLFSYYVQNFAAYNEIFGTLAGVIILLTWLWLSAFVLLLGTQIDAELEHQTMRDSTVGPDRPMGDRGAVKADTLPPGMDQPADPAVTPDELPKSPFEVDEKPIPPDEDPAGKSRQDGAKEAGRDRAGTEPQVRARR
ncbi:YihY/virulence factor BrkB family protein [Citreimonas salinaria]|uniref:Membrane protein n=1 Tax=Citreimonas salinaria TaxID=321339 RepID=A0A1H3J5Z6_9RHOB|nr:YihY/virulence factor BrkB family protein [Citreimonas salinaria]SDY35361.1 membrane protein [Citreimonas salinaria]